jgi:quercetin dioxygenase-like cupin family protein
VESIWFLQNLVDVHVDGTASEERYALVEIAAPAGDQSPLHLHRDADEAFYVVDGELTLWAGDRQVVLRAGESFNAPRGIAHAYRVTSDGPARWITSVSPAGFERFVRAAGRPAARRELPVLDGPPDVERLARLAAEHGIDILGPPGALPGGAADAALAAG